MTAPNNPTPEVELETVAWLIEHAGTKSIVFSKSEADAYEFSYLTTVTPLGKISEAAATISRLTAERDDFEEAYRVARRAYDDENIRAHKQRERAEAAEKRVRELEEERDNLSSIVSSGIDDVAGAALDDAESANKLLSERIAGLEGALEPFKKLAEAVFSNPMNTNSGDAVELFYYKNISITFGHLRRARSLEGK